MPELSPTLGLPMIDYRCTLQRCDHIKGAYRIVGTCLNCGGRAVVLLTSRHEKPPSYSGPDCPTCGCRRWVWGGLALYALDDAASTAPTEPETGAGGDDES